MKTFWTPFQEHKIPAAGANLSGGTTVPDEIYERQCALISEDALFFPLETEKICWKMWGSVGNLETEK